ncbi:hypothetical protein SEUCBS140593_004642 [Sporothrix eucalyptigena]|uniref:D-isomer specific 2-hydroxyacid dehydrogenase NAD-binding domain-containing protein n=1 Tax=Sporothrix eucalyptigena TaxID=1812306 RepID=A0ABP0BPT0_9PEZI
MEAFKALFKITLVTKAAALSGPFYGAMLLMGNSAYDPFDADLFGPLLPGLKIVACVNAGFSEFDLSWFSSNGVYVTNTLNAVSEATADITIFLILGVLRDTSSNEKLVRQGSWKSAKHVARKAAVFGMKIQYYNRSRVAEDEERTLGVTYCKDLDNLLKTSDVVSVNCPLTDSTRGLIGEKQFALMKDGVFLVNTGRGPVLDEKALIASLWSGKVARAGLDVFDNEPKIK